MNTEIKKEIDNIYSAINYLKSSSKNVSACDEFLKFGEVLRRQNELYTDNGIDQLINKWNQLGLPNIDSIIKIANKTINSSSDIKLYSDETFRVMVALTFLSEHEGLDRKVYQKMIQYYREMKDKGYLFTKKGVEELKRDWIYLKLPNLEQTIDRAYNPVREKKQKELHGQITMQDLTNRGLKSERIPKEERPLLLANIKYLMALTNSDIQFLPVKRASEKFEGLDNSKITPGNLAKVEEYVNRLYKLTGKKIKFLSGRLPEKFF